MLTYKENSGYRNDIDGLRAIAVIAVVIFHFGFLVNGFLGVDIFFVISGYLISKMLFLESSEGKLSIKKFYLRRIRRIIPLILFFCTLSLLFSLLFMLPNDLDNVAQSIIATLFFSNNHLLYLTTGNYWNIANELKPLLHTWSLGIEEQFYFLYPFLFYLLRNHLKWIVRILVLFSIISLCFYFMRFNNSIIFYLLPFRFFELSIGGIAGILFLHKQIYFKYRYINLLLLISLLFIDIPLRKMLIPTVCFLTAILLITTDDSTNYSALLLENKVGKFIGKISFSFYLWHQVLLAFTRYIIGHDLTPYMFITLFFLTGLLSIVTYFFLETPFRNKYFINDKMLLISSFLITLFLTTISYGIYLRAGVLKDVPELDLTKSNYQRDMHAQYVERINEFSKKFVNEGKIKVLVAGDSFARDWANVLVESKFNKKINVVWVNKLYRHPELVNTADIIFIAGRARFNGFKLSKTKIEKLEKIAVKKIWCVGTKNFGINNGVFYNYQGQDYCKQRTKMESGYLEANSILKNEWGDKYIDLIELLSDNNNKVSVFTSGCKFISQDSRHLTQPGAKYIGLLLEDKLKTILFKY